MRACGEELTPVAIHKNIGLGAGQDGQRRLVRSWDPEDRTQLPVLLEKQMLSIAEVARINQERRWCIVARTALAAQDLLHLHEFDLSARVRVSSVNLRSQATSSRARFS